MGASYSSESFTIVQDTSHYVQIFILRDEKAFPLTHTFLALGLTTQFKIPSLHPVSGMEILLEIIHLT
jgi:hypothetical protein